MANASKTLNAAIQHQKQRLAGQADYRCANKDLKGEHTRMQIAKVPEGQKK